MLNLNSNITGANSLNWHQYKHVIAFACKVMNFYLDQTEIKQTICVVVLCLVLFYFYLHVFRI